MFLIDWLFDKMGYTKKVYWADVFKNWEDTPKKVATKRKSPAKKTVSKTVKNRAKRA